MSDKKKKKIRKITFLQGKKHEAFDTIQACNGSDFIEFFTDLISKNPQFIFGKSSAKQQPKKDSQQSGEKAGDDEAQTFEKRSSNPLKDNLIFGLTEIMRKIKTKQIVAVIISDPLTIHLQATLVDLCKEFGVPYLFSRNVDRIAAILGLSRLSCIALNDNVKDPSSLCHPLYQIFIKLAPQPVYDFKEPSQQSTVTKFVKKLENLSQNKDNIEFVFDMPQEVNFYIPCEESNHSIISEADRKSEMDHYINIDREVDYFPPRAFFLDIDLTLPWIEDKSSVSKTPNLGKQLFIVNPTSQQSNLNSKVLFSEPETVQLSSSGRVRQRKSKFRKLSMKKK